MFRNPKLFDPSLFALLFAMILGLSATKATANLYTWTGVANNSEWGDANNWNPVNIPGFGDSVVINFGSVSANGADLTLASLTLNGGHLSNVDDLQVSSLTMAGGKVSAAKLRLVGNSIWNGGEINAKIEIPPSVTVSIMGSTTTVLSEGVLMTNEGTVRMTGGRLEGFKDCVIQNVGTWELDSTSNAEPFKSVNGGNIFHNHGVLAKTGGTNQFGLIWNWTFHLNGETRCDAGTLLFDQFTLAVLPAGAQLKGTGTIRFAANTNLNGVITESVANLILDAGNDTLNCAVNSRIDGTLEWQSGKIQGDLTVAVGSTLIATGSGERLMKTSAKIDNYGTLRWQASSPIKGELNSIIHNRPAATVEFAADGSPFNNVGIGNELINEGLMVKSAGLGGSTTCNSWTFRQRGEVRCNASTLILAGTQVFEGTSTVTGSGAVSIEGSTQLPGTLTFSAPTTWKSGTWTGSGGSISGALAWTGGTSAGNWQVAAGGTLDVMIATTSINQINAGSEIGIAGLLKLSSGFLKGATTSSRIRVLNGGELRATGTATLDEFATDKPQLVLDSGGTITSLASGNLRIDWTLENNGSILVAEGTVKINGGGSSTGSLETTGNGVLEFIGGLHTLSSGAEIKNSGSVVVAGGTLAAAVPIEGTLRINTGILQANSPGGEFRLKNGSQWNGGTLKGNHRVLGGATFAVSGTTVKILDTAHLQNSGTLTLTGTGNMRCTDAILRNLAGGMLSSTGPFSLSHFAGSNQFINEGTLRVGTSQSKLTVGFSFTQTASGRLEIGVAGTNSSNPDFDILTVNSTATLAGTLAAVLEGGYQPPVDTTFPILTSLTRIGTFTNLQASYFNATYPAQNVVLVAKASASYDFQAWADSNGLQGADAAADADKDGDGSENLMEYALNMNPNAGEIAPIAATREIISGVPSLVIRYRRWNNRISAGLNYGGQWSTELNDWQTTSIIDEPDPGAPLIAGSQARICHIPAIEAPRFLRLGFW